MYFTSLPDHSKPGFDEQSHFNNFQKHNVIFNAWSSTSYCERHVGCLSIKTVSSGEEWYKTGSHELAVRPAQFLILNDDQEYATWIESPHPVNTVSVFFKKEFAAAVFRDAHLSEETLVDNPVERSHTLPEFFQTLTDVEDELSTRLQGLLVDLEESGYSADGVDEHLVFLLRHLVDVHQADVHRLGKVKAIKAGTKKEIYKRLCLARDMIHSSFGEHVDLAAMSAAACLSTPQLIRQFNAVFQTTPHQYLIKIRLSHSIELLKRTSLSVNEISRACGFDDTSAFCRLFKKEHAVSPLSFRVLAN